MSDLDLRLMAYWFRLRDYLLPPAERLREVGLQPGHKVLDYGCGPGSYALVSAQLVGDEGKAYAVDVNPTTMAS